MALSLFLSVLIGPSKVGFWARKVVDDGGVSFIKASICTTSKATNKRTTRVKSIMVIDEPKF